MPFPIQRHPVPRSLLRRPWVAVWWGAAFLGLTTVQGALRADFDSWHQAVSALSLGPGGWLQSLNLVAFGAVIASTAPVWRRIMAGGRGGTSYPVLTALVGLSFITVGLIPQDPAPGYDPAGLALQGPTARGLLHLAIAGIAASCSVASLIVMGSRLAGDRAWGGWRTAAWVTALLIVACVTVFGVWSTKPSGFAGTFERMAIVLPLAWTAIFLRRLDSGTPFMLVSDPMVRPSARAREVVRVVE
jgi:hypothetical protein